MESIQNMHLAGEVEGGLNKTRNLSALLLNQGHSMPLLREDTCLEPPHTGEGHKKSAGEHQGLGGFWLPPLVLSLPNFGFSGNAQNELGTGFVWLGFTRGGLGDISNKMHSRNQCFILSVPSLPLAGVTARNFFVLLEA